MNGTEFKEGDKIRLSVDGKEMFRKDTHDRTGVVLYIFPRVPGYIAVRWNGRKTHDVVWHRWIEKVKGD